MLTRRAFLRGLAGIGGAFFAGGAYGFGVEPHLRLRVQRWQVSPPGWTAGPLRIVALADPHLGKPFMGAERLARIVERANALEPDLIVLLGDYVASHPLVLEKVPSATTAAVFRGLEAPLGVHVIMGNHDWWDDAEIQVRRTGRPAMQRVYEAAGLSVLHNAAVRIGEGAGAFWLLGLGSQIAYVQTWDPVNRRVLPRAGVDDLEGTLAQVTDTAPAILLAHEPDIFPRVPDRVSLTLSGHTHGGQVRILGYAPVVPSRYGNRFAYGHIVEEDRHLVVSGGLGCSVAPLRFGSPPEITVIELG
ncbi:MAG: metallophosphoesterase [Pseudomonadota bacterium]